ncbi:MAG: ABC transporter permease [Leucobacter sp.]
MNQHTANQHTAPNQTAHNQTSRDQASGSRATGAPAVGNTPAKGVWLVAEREITTKLRSKAFLISSGVLLLLVLGSVLFSGFMAKSGGFGGPTRVATVAATADLVSTEVFERVTVADRAAAEQAVLGGEVDAAVVPGGDTAVGLTVLAQDSPPGDLVQMLSATPSIELLAPTTDNPALAYLIAVAFGVVFMFSAITFGTTIAQSVVEEKQTRIVEILLATVSARTMLAGKILGNSILAIGQVVAIVAVASIGMLATGQDLLLGELGTSLIWFGILFAFGFVLLATMYAALATLVSRQEDVASAVSPVMWLVMLPYMAIIFFNDNPQALLIMSYVPFSAPIGMPMRLYLGMAEWWEPILSLGVLVVSIAVVLWIGARIYSNSILRTGVRVKLSEAIRG